MAINVKIEIECDEPNEIIQHLNKIKSDIMKEIKKDSDFTEIHLDDNNCYGNHGCLITEF